MQMKGTDFSLCIFRPHEGFRDMAVKFCAHIKSTQGFFVHVCDSLKEE